MSKPEKAGAAHQMAGRHVAGTVVAIALTICGTASAGTASSAAATGTARSSGPVTARGPANVDAASLAEDVTPSGVHAYGQSEVTIAAAGRYVVAAWNDSTGLISRCPSPESKEERIGFGFSANGGKSFSDMGGLPNAHCRSAIYLADPSAVAYLAGGRTYFYISGIYAAQSLNGIGRVAMAACAVVARARAASLHCSQPVFMATSPRCANHRRFCDFLDKDYLAVDQARGRLYVSFTNTASGVELAVCDLGTRAGRPGPLDGTPAEPVCENGAKRAPAPAYFTVSRGNPAGCEETGAYPAVDPVSGAVYVGYEFNWFSNAQPGPCRRQPTLNILARIPLRCLPLAPVSPCGRPAAIVAVPVTSMDRLIVPNNGSLNDFPRVAVSVPADTVSMVWNDGRHHRLGDILLRSFSLGSLAPVQHRPVVLNQPIGGFHIYPAVRTATATGRLDITWYQTSARRTTSFGVVAALRVDPRRAASPRNTVRITTATWNPAKVVSMFGALGDYTDNAIAATAAPPYVSSTLFVAWADGRLGVAQPFVARLPSLTGCC